MEKLQKRYLTLFLGAVIIFAFGLTFILSDLYNKVGIMEHEMMHLKDARKGVICPVGK